MIWGVLLLMVTVHGAPAGQAAQDQFSKDNLIDKDSTSPEGVADQGIRCSWPGWLSAYPEVKCKRDRCDKYTVTLKFNCSGGVITEVKATRVCMRCFEF